MGCGAGKYKPETFVLPHQQNAAPVKKMPQQPEQQKTELPAAANPPQPKKLEPIKNAGMHFGSGLVVLTSDHTGDSPFDNTSVESVIAEIAAKYKVSEELQEKTLQTLHDNGIFIMEGFRDMREGMPMESSLCNVTMCSQLMVHAVNLFYSLIHAFNVIIDRASRALTNSSLPLFLPSSQQTIGTNSVFPFLFVRLSKNVSVLAQSHRLAVPPVPILLTIATATTTAPTICLQLTLLKFLKR